MAQFMTEHRSAPGVTGHSVTVAAAQTDSVVIAARSGSKIRVRAAFINGTDAGASTVTFNSKGGGAGTAISPALKVTNNTALTLPDCGGWFETNAGEALTVTTAAASAVAIIAIAEYVD
jgi:hypothetical protein